jgi:hypothetical protein
MALPNLTVTQKGTKALFRPLGSTARTNASFSLADGHKEKCSVLIFDEVRETVVIPHESMKGLAHW